MRTTQSDSFIESESAGAREQQEAIRRRAEEIYIRSGRIPGRDVENWVQAESEILREAEERASRQTAVVVKVDGSSTWASTGRRPQKATRPGSLPRERLFQCALRLTRCASNGKTAAR